MIRYDAKNRRGQATSYTCSIQQRPNRTGGAKRQTAGGAAFCINDMPIVPSEALRRSAVSESDHSSTSILYDISVDTYIKVLQSCTLCTHHGNFVNF